MQAPVVQLSALGPLPASDDIDEGYLQTVGQLLDEIQKPIGDDDAGELAKLFGPDDCFGVVWTLIHLIETAPNWPIAEALADPNNEWIKTLRQRAKNGGYML